MLHYSASRVFWDKKCLAKHQSHQEHINPINEVQNIQIMAEILWVVRFELLQIPKVDVIIWKDVLYKVEKNLSSWKRQYTGYVVVGELSTILKVLFHKYKKMPGETWSLWRNTFIMQICSLLWYLNDRTQESQPWNLMGNTACKIISSRWLTLQQDLRPVERLLFGLVYFELEKQEVIPIKTWISCI